MATTTAAAAAAPSPCAEPPPNSSCWGKRVGAAWRAHVLTLEVRAIEAACQERLRHVASSTAPGAAAAREAIRQRALKAAEDARERHLSEAAADAREAFCVASQQRARLRRLARTAARAEAATAAAAGMAGAMMIPERGEEAAAMVIMQQQQRQQQHSHAQPRPPPKRTLSEETRRARGLLGLGLGIGEAPASAAAVGGLSLGAGDEGEAAALGLGLGFGLEGSGQAVAAAAVARALLSSSPTTSESVLVARPLLLSSLASATTQPPQPLQPPISSGKSGVAVGGGSVGGGLMDALLAWGPGPRARKRREAGAAAAREAARRRWRRLQEGRPLVAFFAPMFEAPGGVGGGGIDLSSSSIGSSYSQSHSRSDWTDPAWEANALQALGPALPPPPPPPPPRVGSPTDDATASASASAASASAAAQAAAQAVMVPYIEALLRLPPQLRRHPPALTRSPSKSHHQAAPLSPTRSSSSSSNTSAAITATVLDCHHRHHPLGQAALRFLLYLEEAYAAAPTADNPDNTDTDPQKQDADDEEEADYPLLLDGMATDVSRFLTYMEAGLRLAWPRLAATRPDALTLLRRDLHRAAFTLLSPPILGLCQRAHAATEARLLGPAAGHGRGRGRGGLAVGLGVPPRYRLDGSEEAKNKDDNNDGDGAAAVFSLEEEEGEREARAYEAYRPAIAEILRAAASTTSTTSTTSCLAPSAAGRQAQEEGEGEREGEEAWVDAKARHLRRALHEVCSCIDRYHKHAKAKAAARSPPPLHPPLNHQQRFFLPPGTGAGPDPSGMGVGSPAATLFMASDELLPVLEYVVCLAYHPPPAASSSSSGPQPLPPLRHLAAHLEVLDRFLDEDSKRKEEGFALCTFQAAVADLVMAEHEQEQEERGGGGLVGMGTVVEGEEEEAYEDAVEEEEGGTQAVVMAKGRPNGGRRKQSNCGRSVPSHIKSERNEAMK